MKYKRYITVCDENGIPIDFKPTWWDKLYAFPQYATVRIMVFFMPNHPFRGVSLNDWSMRRTKLAMQFDFIAWEIIFLWAVLAYILFFK